MIVFVCTGNTCRSPMAQALYNHLTQGEHSTSAGLGAFPGDGTSPKAVEALREMGMEAQYIPAQARPFVPGEDFHLILTMERRHRDAIRSHFPALAGMTFTLREYAYGQDGDVLDPYGGSLHTYRACAKEIFEAVKALCQKGEKRP